MQWPAACASSSAAKVLSALPTRRTVPSGWWQAPRPSTSPAQRAMSSRVPQRHAEGGFEDPCPAAGHMHRAQGGARFGRGAHRAEPVGAVAGDQGETGERLAPEVESAEPLPLEEVGLSEGA
ncbi:hypothetical protein ACFTZF_17945 [Streptomyces mirabilis]|uniref:hypothetical protein n=1 Tax=Streptomyces mirabilis TaxID=68239 RepID=UPI00363066D4